jgi:hypothetical protein
VALTTREPIHNGDDAVRKYAGNIEGWGDGGDVARCIRPCRDFSPLGTRKASLGT